MTSKKLLCACVGVVLVAILCAGCAGTPKAPPAVETGVVSADQVQEFRRAAELGDSKAQFSLGRCYADGTGVAKDQSEAVKWVRKAAEQGYAEAQYNFGVCYFMGTGVAKDQSEAARWFRKAAEQGHEKSKEALRTLGADTPSQSKVGRADFERDATSGDSKLVMICTGSVEYYDIKLRVAMSFMESECSRQGIRVLTRSDFEDRVRAVLKKNGADSIKLQYKDDGTTKTITVAP